MKQFALFLMMLALPLQASSRDVESEQLSIWIDSYPLLENILPKIKSAQYLEIFEGLPHPLWEENLLKSEKQKTNIFQKYYFYFYSAPQIANDLKLKAFKAVLTTKHALQPLMGVKACGGFHPDYLLRFTYDHSTIDVQICLGCHEYRIFTNDVGVYGDLGEAAYDSLALLLKNYHQQRPKEK